MGNRILLSFNVVIVGLVLLSCGPRYIDPDYDGELQYNSDLLINQSKTPTTENCHVRAVGGYMDRLETMIDDFNGTVARLEDLTQRGIDDPELLQGDLTWVTEYADIAEELTEWIAGLENVKVPIPLYHMHNYNLSSIVHIIGWKMDVGRWLMQKDRSDRTLLDDALNREDEWAAKAQEEWETYHNRCGDLYTEYREG